MKTSLTILTTLLLAVTARPSGSDHDKCLPRNRVTPISGAKRGLKGSVMPNFLRNPQTLSQLPCRMHTRRQFWGFG